MIFYVLIWLVFGITAAFFAHRDLRRDLKQKTGQRQPLGRAWAVWGPFLGFLVAFGPASLVAVYFIASEPEGT